MITCSSVISPKVRDVTASISCVSLRGFYASHDLTVQGLLFYKRENRNKRAVAINVIQPPSVEIGAGIPELSGCVVRSGWLANPQRVIRRMR
jgi:hypothetical protein